MKFRQEPVEMATVAGSIKLVIDKLIYLWNRINQKIDGNLAKDDTVLDLKELERTRNKLAQMRYRNSNSESTGSFAIDSVRRRITGEVSEIEMVNIRHKNRQAVAKWFNKDDQSESGNFNTDEFNRRLVEVQLACEENQLEPLPAIEDTFMAFSRPEENLFDEDPISLSGVHYRVDPIDDFDEAYTTPLLPMYGVSLVEVDESNNIDFTPQTVEEQTEAEAAAAAAAARKALKASNPMIQVLDNLEERIGKNYQSENYWVE